MLTSKYATLRPLIESTGGLHLTIYLENTGHPFSLRPQLRSAILQSYKWLDLALNREEREKFLEPLVSVQNDSRILRQMKGNIGIFRNEDSFRILSIPVDVRPSCQVATTFHVKPLLRWLQADREFLLLGMSAESAQLYLGSQYSFKLIDSVLFPDCFKQKTALDGYASLKEFRVNKTKQEETYAWMAEWILQVTRNSKPILYLAGEEAKVEGLHRSLSYPQAVRAGLANSFGRHNVSELCAHIRRLMKEEANQSLESVLREFRVAFEENRTRQNIFQITRAAVQGRVKKLIVTDEMSIFGKIDTESAGLAIHPCDLDHEDDDILDDLAQMVFCKGGEVVVIERDKIPKGRPILAILDDKRKEAEISSNARPFGEWRGKFG